MTFKEIAEIGSAVIVGLGGGGGIVLGLSNYVGKLWADRALQEQRQEHARMNLELTHQLGLLTQQSQYALQMRALEHQVRFSKLHEKRAEVLAEIYQRALDTDRHGQEFTLTVGLDLELENQQESFASAQKKMFDFYDFVERHRIYLPEETCELLNDFAAKMTQQVVSIGIHGSPDNTTSEDLKQKKAAFRRHLKCLKKRFQH